MSTADGTSARVHDWRRERRAAVRAHHPDRGGSVDALMHALIEVDRRYGYAPGTDAAEDGPAEVTVRHTRTYRIRLRGRRLRLLLQALRTRLPAGWPGARRDIRL